VKYEFDQEFISGHDLSKDEPFFDPQLKAAAKLLKVAVEDLYAGNRHNTPPLDQVYEDLHKATPKAEVDVEDEFNIRLHLYDYKDMEVVLCSDYIGVFFTKEVGQKILELNADWGGCFNEP
jgi:hypothetical protein